MTAKKIGRYDLVRDLGQSPLGSLWQAAGPDGDVFVRACRVRPPTSKSDSDHVAEAARLAIGLEHERVASVLEVVTEPGLFAIVQDAHRGDLVSNLQKQTLIQRHPMPPAVVVRVAADLCEALAFVHEQASELPVACVYGGVSPDSAIIGEDGICRLYDVFAVAAATGDGWARAPRRAAYQSPEHFHKRKLEPASDVFALAALVWELCLNRALFVSTSYGEVQKRVLAPVKRADSMRIGSGDHLPTALADVLARALRADPSERYASSEAFGEALAEAEPPAAHADVAQLLTELGGTKAAPAARPRMPTEELGDADLQTSAAALAPRPPPRLRKGPPNLSALDRKSPEAPTPARSPRPGEGKRGPGLPPRTGAKTAPVAPARRPAPPRAPAVPARPAAPADEEFDVSLDEPAPDESGDDAQFMKRSDLLAQRSTPEPAPAEPSPATPSAEPPGDEGDPDERLSDADRDTQRLGDRSPSTPEPPRASTPSKSDLSPAPVDEPPYSPPPAEQEEASPRPVATGEAMEGAPPEPEAADAATDDAQPAVGTEWDPNDVPDSVQPDPPLAAAAPPDGEAESGRAVSPSADEAPSNAADAPAEAAEPPRATPTEASVSTATDFDDELGTAARRKRFMVRVVGGALAAVVVIVVIVLATSGGGSNDPSLAAGSAAPSAASSRTATSVATAPPPTPTASETTATTASASESASASASASASETASVASSPPATTIPPPRYTGKLPPPVQKKKPYVPGGI